MCYKAIITKYLGPTNTKGSRIRASDEDGNRVIVSYDHRLNVPANHRAAAEALMQKMGWDKWAAGGCTPLKTRLVAGSTKRGFAFIMLHEPEQVTQ